MDTLSIETNRDTPASPSPLGPVNFFTGSLDHPFASLPPFVTWWDGLLFVGLVESAALGLTRTRWLSQPVYPPNSALHECSLSTVSQSVCAVGSVAEYSQSVSQQHISSYQLSSAQLSSVSRLAVLVDRLID
jgi:hypothetical protein